MKHIVQPVPGKPGRIAVARIVARGITTAVCDYPAVAWHIAEAHADRLTLETAQPAPLPANDARRIPAGFYDDGALT